MVNRAIGITVFMLDKVAKRFVLAVIAFDLIMMGNPWATYRMCECLARIIFTGETPLGTACGIISLNVPRRTLLGFW